jgi:hypothetical protein
MTSKETASKAFVQEKKDPDNNADLNISAEQHPQATQVFILRFSINRFTTLGFWFASREDIQDSSLFLKMVRKDFTFASSFHEDKYVLLKPFFFQKLLISFEWGSGLDDHFAIRISLPTNFKSEHDIRKAISLSIEMCFGKL